MALYNLARVTTATTGTGTITLGSAVSGFLTFALAGVPDGAVLSYGISDGFNSEVGTGTYTATGTTLTRTVTKSTNANAAISLSGSAQVFITPRAEDINLYAAPFDALAYNGMQVNGSFDVDQERVGAASTGGFQSLADGWSYYQVGTMAPLPCKLIFGQRFAAVVVVATATDPERIVYVLAETRAVTVAAPITQVNAAEDIRLVYASAQERSVVVAPEIRSVDVPLLVRAIAA